jgi:hypothetical protein
LRASPAPLLGDGEAGVGEEHFDGEHGRGVGPDGARARY